MLLSLYGFERTHHHEKWDAKKWGKNLLDFCRSGFFPRNVDTHAELYKMMKIIIFYQKKRIHRTFRIKISRLNRVTECSQFLLECKFILAFEIMLNKHFIYSFQTKSPFLIAIIFVIATVTIQMSNELSVIAMQYAMFSNIISISNSNRKWFYLLLLLFIGKKRNPVFYFRLSSFKAIPNQKKNWSKNK